MQLLFWLYVAVGVVPWGAFCAGILVNRKKMRRMFEAPPPLPAPPPGVTIVTPAKDESAHIEACVLRLMSQDYRNYFVRVINDRSSDGTAECLDRLARERSPGGDQPEHGSTAAKARLSVLHIAHLPGGWLGKCNALHEGTRDVDSDWLLFVDSDVSIEPDALSRTVAFAAARGYDAVSLLPRLDARSFIERLMIPVCGTSWGIMTLMHWTNDDRRPTYAVANGQFFLVRREAYEHVGGHQGVRQEIVEDVELMRSLKAAGYRCRLFAAPHLVATRMHATAAELRSGWGRIFAGTSRFRPGPMIGAIAFLLVSGLSVYPMLAFGAYRATVLHDGAFLAAAGGHWILMTLFLAYTYHAVRVGVAHGLLPIASFPMLIGLLWEGIRRCSDRKFAWRGTAVEIARE
ncbi:MAG TPA: glycosyltransferase family 2 protein [Tepidisphaeraceae bacterium]|nr:glycosyltransferase family 2 protein [Tepidisphaeraceae bacterium]